MRQVVQRFIPTPVGNADSPRPVPARRAVHPHARGERAHRCSVAVFAYGSSPRPWGTRHGHHVARAALRFIPTPVGNADSTCSRLKSQSGSSPRPWGTPLWLLVGCVSRRFIPTPVGNAASSWPRVGATPVHPHARGERHGLPDGKLRVHGSSPRPWGTQRHRHACDGHGRFIPTPVGNACACPATAACPSVHPHARGERAPVNPATGQPYGSSPRPWGTLHAASFLVSAWRFIPTPVGNAPPGGSPANAGSVHPHARGERG